MVSYSTDCTGITTCDIFIGLLMGGHHVSVTTDKANLIKVTDCNLHNGIMTGVWPPTTSLSRLGSNHCIMVSQQKLIFSICWAKSYCSIPTVPCTSSVPSLWLPSALLDIFRQDFDELSLVWCVNHLPWLLSGPLFTLCSQADIGYHTYRQVNLTRLSLPNFRIHGVRMGNCSLKLWKRWAAGKWTLVNTRASRNQRTMWMSGMRTDCNAKVLSGHQIKAVVCSAARKRR